MFKSSLVTSLLISSVCTFAKADGITVDNSLLSTVSNSNPSPLSLGVAAQSVAEQPIAVQSVADLDQVSAAAISADAVEIQQTTPETNVMPQYVSSAGGDGLSFPFAFAFEVMAIGVLLIGVLVLFFRFASNVVHMVE